MVSRWVVAMVAVGGYKDVQCKEVGVVVDLLCVTDLAEMNFVACWKISCISVSDSDLIYVWYVYVLLDN